MMQLLALVVDDSMLIRHVVCRFLEQRGFRVETASNGAEALELIEAEHPAFVVTDIDMPRMNGTELMEALSNKPELARIPVIVLAGRKTASEAGIEDFAQHIVYKDIDLTAQLDRAITEISRNLPSST